VLFIFQYENAPKLVLERPSTASATILYHFIPCSRNPQVLPPEIFEKKGKKKKEKRKRKRKRSVLAAANIQKAHLDFGLELSSGLVRSMESLRLGEMETALLP